MVIQNPFLLKVHSDFANGFIKLEDLKDIIRICISYVFRRGICDIPTNSLNKTFATLRNEIKFDNYLNSIKAYFALQTGYKEFPNDERFTLSFVTKDIYNMRSRNFILSHLENYNKKAPITIENYTIEHIMPQNVNLSKQWIDDLGPNFHDVQKKYLHTIGNLTLTAYNSEMSDKPFIEKLEMEGGFKQSALIINSFLINQLTWNETNILARADSLAKKAVKIWQYPNLSEVELAPFKFVEKDFQKYNLETYEFNATTKRLFDSIDRRIMNLSSDVNREFKKLYIAYKLETNFADIVVQKTRLRISVNMIFDDVRDPYGICRDVSSVGRWGNGEVELFFGDESSLENVMNIIQQSFDLQTE